MSEFYQKLKEQLTEAYKERGLTDRVLDGYLAAIYDAELFFRQNQGTDKYVEMLSEDQLRYAQRAIESRLNKIAESEKVEIFCVSDTWVNHWYRDIESAHAGLIEIVKKDKPSDRAEYKIRAVKVPAETLSEYFDD